MTSSWCVVAIGGQEVKAKIIHKGRGKFEIAEIEGSQPVGKLVDASDIIFCLDPNFVKARAVGITKEARAIMEQYLSGSIDKTRAKTELNKLLDEISV